jgi:site-specific recombinase XerD
MTVTNLVSLEARRTDIGRPLSWPLQPVAALQRSLEPTQLLADHAEFIATLSCNQQAKRLRQRGAEQHLASFANLVEWMDRPSPTRVAEARRFGSWPFLSWCFVTERLRPDAELLILKGRGTHFTMWASFHRQDADRATAAASSLGWCQEWIGQVAGAGLALVCLTCGITLEQVNDHALRSVEAEITSSPILPAVTRRHLHARLYGLSVIAYQLGLLPRPPEHPNRRTTSLADRLAPVPQPVIRAAMLRYLNALSTTRRPKTVTERAACFVVFTQWLGEHDPHVTSLRQLTRAHLEDFLIWHANRGWVGRVARDQHISRARHHSAVVALRTFFDDITLWGWSERPPAPVLLRSDLPRIPEALPRALSPDHDRALMAAVHELTDPAARAGIILLRGTGMRIGELLDLELDCLWDLPGHGTWLKVPLGKLDTERVVPLDQHTLAVLREWLAARPQNRSLPHPRQPRPADFLFVSGGHRIAASRIRRGLDEAVRAAGLKGPDGTPLTVTPHQLRHTYATELINAGMSLQALMMLLGHVTPEMTLRYARLANPTLRTAYDAAIERVHATTLVPLVIDSRPMLPDPDKWLQTEAIKTRLAGGYCSRPPVAGACPYANICEQCDSFTTSPGLLPVLSEQLRDVRALHDDALFRGWAAEAKRHELVIQALNGHLNRAPHQDRQP